MRGVHHSLATVTAMMVMFVPVIVLGDGKPKPKAFITGNNSFHVSGSGGETSVSGVADSTAAEGIKLFRKECPSVEVTVRQDRADYIVGVTDDGSGAGRRGRRAVVSTSDGTVVFANSTRSLKNVVKDACKAIDKEWLARP